MVAQAHILHGSAAVPRLSRTRNSRACSLGSNTITMHWNTTAGHVFSRQGRRTAASPQLRRQLLVRAEAPTENVSVDSEVSLQEQGVTADAAAADTQVAKVEESDAAVDVKLRAGEAMKVDELVYVAPSGSDRTWTSLKLAFALPWRRFKKDSVLTILLSGDLPEQLQGRFSPGISLPVLTNCLRKAALDPRINGICIKISPLAMGWGKLLEIRRHIEYFRQSGKYTIAYIERGGEKEYLLASACEQVYIPPTAQLSLRGFTVTGTFLRGTLNKIGVEPQVKRIGEYKSAGDQLLREDMSAAQREQLTALLEDIYLEYCQVVASALNKTPEEVAILLDQGVYDMNVLKQQGWVTDLKYADEVEEELKKRTGGKEDEVQSVALSKYQYVSAGAFVHDAKKVIAVIRASGAIVGGSGSASAGNITQDQVIKQLRAARDNKKVEAVVLRVDSPGGDALASDLMWREIVALAKKKPVIASMADVAASGGYYMSMAAKAIVAERLTITGSIGVVTGKFNLEGVYNRIGYNKVLISEGKYAQLLADNRPFSSDEQLLFDEAAEFAYKSFRDRAAQSRGMAAEDMQKVAQGRVWSGLQALEAGLVDALGGINRAILLAKEAAGIPLTDKVRILELSRARPSPLQLLSSGAVGGAHLQQLLLQSALAGPLSSLNPAARAGALALLSAACNLAQNPLGAQYVATLANASFTDGRPQYLMPTFSVDGAGSAAAVAASESDPQTVEDVEAWLTY